MNIEKYEIDFWQFEFYYFDVLAKLGFDHPLS